MDQFVFWKLSKLEFWLDPRGGSGSVHVETKSVCDNFLKNTT